MRRIYSNFVFLIISLILLSTCAPSDQIDGDGDSNQESNSDFNVTATFSKNVRGGVQNLTLKVKTIPVDQGNRIYRAYVVSRYNGCSEPLERDSAEEKYYEKMLFIPFDSPGKEYTFIDKVIAEEKKCDRYQIYLIFLKDPKSYLENPSPDKDNDDCETQNTKTIWLPVPNSH